MQNTKIHGIKDSNLLIFKKSDIFSAFNELLISMNNRSINSEVIKMAWDQESEDKSDDFEGDSDWEDDKDEDNDKEETDSDSESDGGDW